MMGTYGLIGKNIAYSFSKKYFTEKFSSEGTQAKYLNFDIPEIADFKRIIKSQNEINGLNVTIPYKEQIIPFLDGLDSTAAEIGAVNTIKVLKSGELKGFNTDYYGFTESIRPLLRPQHKKALVLGTGGASKAIVFGLKSLGIESILVSRTKKESQLSYDQLDEEIMEAHLVIVNCTPLGTSPRTSECPELPFQHISEKHLVFDLIYNPPTTKLMELSEKRGATVANGSKMLELQAEKAWEIWNSENS